MAGIVPERLFPWRLRTSKLIKFPIEGGIDPERLLSPKYNSMRFVKLVVTMVISALVVSLGVSGAQAKIYHCNQPLQLSYVPFPTMHVSKF